MPTISSEPLRSDPAPLYARRSAKAIAINNDIYLFGGIGADGSESILDVNDHLWKFDTDELSWSRIKKSEPWPSPRRWPGWDTDGSVAYLWGGSSLQELDPSEPNPNENITAPEDASVTYDFRNDLWRFDPAEIAWTKVTESDDFRTDEYVKHGRPRPRYTAVFHRFDDQFFVFSGKTQTRAYENVRLADVWICEADGSWRQLEVGDSVLGVSEEADWPAERYGAMWAATEDAVFVCGGYGEHSYNDLWRFDLDTEQWQLLSPHQESDNRHEPRYGSAFVEYDGTLYLFGGRSREHPVQKYNGLWTYGLANGEWSRIQATRTPHRYDETATYPGYHSKSATAVVGTDWYIWGGEGRHGHVSDLWRFNLETHEWQFVQPQRSDDPIFW
jgi:N-acetylneuraminic acid mutarotase